MLMELKPDKIGVVAVTNDEVLTGYYGDCTHVDKATMAHHLNIDATMDVVMANAKEITQAAEEESDAQNN